MAFNDHDDDKEEPEDNRNDHDVTQDHLTSPELCFFPRMLRSNMNNNVSQCYSGFGRQCGLATVR